MKKEIEGQLSIFDLIQPEQPEEKYECSSGASWRYLRYGPHTLVPEAREAAKRYFDKNGVPAAFNWDKNSLPCENCKHYDGKVCRSGGHTCHYEYEFLICDGFEQTIQQELGHFYQEHGKRLKSDELIEYCKNEMAVLVNACTESQEFYKLVRIVDVTRDRVIFTYGTRKEGYVSRKDVDGNRGRINFQCDACNESGWFYRQSGEAETYPKGDKCLLNVDHVCTKKCDAVIRQNCTEWKPEICKHSGHECNKKYLWEVADSLDSTQCPHVCCRRCTTKGCGARCNGSEEPKEIRQWYRFCKHQPPKSGYYEIIDINGTKGRAWYEKGRGFDHSTGYDIECWRVNDNAFKVSDNVAGLYTWRNMHCSECANCYKVEGFAWCEHTGCIENDFRDYKENKDEH